MKNFPFIIVLALSAAFLACQKQQTDEERRAEVERQVQERLAAERQQQQAQELAQREGSVSAREQALREREQAASATPEASVATETSSVGEPSNSYSVFYTGLEPYGDWIETDEYGYVFRPRAAENSRWRPYTDGRWVYTDAGWTWVSDEPFGWATYHYGRWTRIRGIGWVWVPGNEWAPAWVSWRKGGQYVGWAPLPPEAHFDRASGIRNWSDSYYDVGPDQYVFVPVAEFGEQRLAQVIVPEQQNVTIVTQTTNITNITYNNTTIVNQGPGYDELRAQSRVPIQRLRLERETTVPAENAHAVVRGAVVAIPAPVIAAPRPQERPRAVKQTVTKAPTDRGWGAVANQREAEQARAKMQAEATPPPNAPPKKFIKPAAATSPTTATRPPVATSTAPAHVSITPAITSTARAVQTPAATPARSLAPVVSAAPSVSSTATPRPTATEHRRPLPPNRPAPTASVSLSAAPTATSPPLGTPPQSAVLPRRAAQAAVPTASVPPSPQTENRADRRFASPSPANTAHSTATPALTATPSTAASPLVSPQANAAAEPRRANRERQLQRQKNARQTTASPSPTPP